MRISEREDKLTRTSTMTLWLSHSSMNSGLLFLLFWKESSPLKATLKETSALRCYVCPSTACVAKLILTSKQQFPWLRPRLWRLTVPMIQKPPFYRLACQILRVLLTNSHTSFKIIPRRWSVSPKWIKHSRGAHHLPWPQVPDLVPRGLYVSSVVPLVT